MRRWLVVAAALLIVTLLVVFLMPREDLRSGSELLGDGGVRIGRRVASAYRIVYRIEDRSGGELTISRDDVLVRRPFEARVASKTVEESITLYGFGRFSVRGQAFVAEPGAAIPDLRPDAMIAEAVADGYAQERERRRVVGRICRVHRLGVGTDSSSLPRVADLEGDYTDACIDEAGLVLEEATYTEGDLVRRRIATRVTEDPPIAEDAFEIDKPKGDPRKVGSLQKLEPDSRLPGDEYWELSKKPKGFHRVGRYAVIPPGQPGFNDPVTRSSVITFVSEVWTGGTDILVIDQGSTQGAAPFADDPNAGKVKAGDLGKGELIYSFRASEVRVLLGGPRFVRVRGTLEPSRLLAIARSLEAVPGGPLRVKR